MKKLSCRDVGGACDAMLFGDTLRDIGAMAKAHAIDANDDAHRAKMAEMIEKSAEEMRAFWAEALLKFEAAPEA